MATLLLRLAAPLQAWGADSKFETRRTNREPTKSGVLGMLAAALGLRRDDDVSLQKLNKLQFGVRIDKEGKLLVDFHMANPPSGDYKYVNYKPPGNGYVTYRHYLSDAVFLAGLSCDDKVFLEKLQGALLHPVFPLFLGRRSCPPSLPLVLGIREAGLEEALKNEPALLYERKKQAGTLRIVMDASPEDKGSAFVHDLPLSFSPMYRKHGYRRAKEFMYSVMNDSENTADVMRQEHDPFAELR